MVTYRMGFRNPGPQFPDSIGIEDLNQTNTLAAGTYSLTVYPIIKPGDLLVRGTWKAEVNNAPIASPEQVSATVLPGSPATPGGPLNHMRKDTAQRIAEIVFPRAEDSGGTQKRMRFSVSRDRLERIQNLTYPHGLGTGNGGTVLAYQYQSDTAQLETIADQSLAQGSGSQTLIDHIEYGPRNLLLDFEFFGDGFASTYNHPHQITRHLDSLSRIASYQFKTGDLAIQNRHYGFDRSGRIRFIKTTPNGRQNWHIFGYDALGQLQNAQALASDPPAGTSPDRFVLNNTYDTQGFGNLTQLSSAKNGQPAMVYTLDTNGHSNRLDGAGFAYNDWGEMTAGNTRDGRPFRPK